VTHRLIKADVLARGRIRFRDRVLRKLNAPSAKVHRYDVEVHWFAMPIRRKTACSTPGCGELRERGGRCPKHSRQRERQRGSARERGYDRTWEKLRRMKLAHDPLCQIQTHCSGATLATEVDHRVPIRQRPDLRLVMSNLQSACHRCHAAKTVRESGGWYP
jgi:5-methylcytosine-specific restriction protein A